MQCHGIQCTTHTHTHIFFLFLLFFCVVVGCWVKIKYSDAAMAVCYRKMHHFWCHVYKCTDLALCGEYSCVICYCHNPANTLQKHFLTPQGDSTILILLTKQQPTQFNPHSSLKLDTSTQLAVTRYLFIIHTISLMDECFLCQRGPNRFINCVKSLTKRIRFLSQFCYEQWQS